MPIIGQGKRRVYRGQTVISHSGGAPVTTNVSIPAGTLADLQKCAERCCGATCTINTNATARVRLTSLTNLQIVSEYFDNTGSLSATVTVDWLIEYWED